MADHPRASALNARTMEFMRRWGLADAVREAGTPEDFPHTALYCTKLTGFEIARIERPGHGGRQPSATSPERPQRCNQLWLDPILREAAESYASVTVELPLAIREPARRRRLHASRPCMTSRATNAARSPPVIVIDCSGGHAVRSARRSASA